MTARAVPDQVVVIFDLLDQPEFSERRPNCLASLESVHPKIWATSLHDPCLSIDDLEIGLMFKAETIERFSTFSKSVPSVEEIKPRQRIRSDFGKAHTICLYLGKLKQ